METDFEYGEALRKKRKMKMESVDQPSFSDVAEKDIQEDLQKPLDSSYQRKEKPIEQEIQQTGKDIKFISGDMDMDMDKDRARTMKEAAGISKRASGYMKQAKGHLPSAYSAAKKAGDKDSSKKFMEMIKKQAARKTPSY